MTSNPFDRIDRPKKNKFTGENYSEEELIAMLGLIRGDIIYPAVMLAGGSGAAPQRGVGRTVVEGRLGEENHTARHQNH